jgi:hypothetical protein
MTVALLRLEEQEVSREVAEDGSVHIRTSRLAGVNLGEAVDQSEDGRINIHAATLADGRAVFVALLAHTESPWMQSGSRVGGGRPSEYKYVATREFFHGGGSGEAYASVQDLKSALGDQAVLNDCYERARQLTAAALSAAKAVQDAAGEPASRDGLSRAGYEAACQAISLDPCPEEEVDFFGGKGSGGVYNHGSYSVEHIVWMGLVYKRKSGQDWERTQRETAAMAAVKEAVGESGPLSRADYEAACTAAGMAPLSDEQVCFVVDASFAQYQPVVDILAVVQGEGLLGDALPKVAQHLSDRRYDGLGVELAEKRKADRAERAAAGTEFATERQVDYIMELLAQRERTGEGGGFFQGPTDRAGVANLSKADASLYITSLKDEY